MSCVCISLGSNMGDRLQNLQKAAQLISSNFSVVKAASVYETPPYGFTEQNSFFNTALEIETTEAPTIILNILLDIEKKMGRQRDKKWGPRNIDLDIIFYGNEIINKPELKIPHPDYKNRIFVLKPVAEIMFDFIPPDDNNSIETILNNLTVNEEKNGRKTKNKKIVKKWMI